MEGILGWVIFNLFVLAALAVDLGVFNKRAHVVSIKESFFWSIFWTALALVFNVGLLYWLGHQKALEFFTGYVIERSLSTDNLFVFILIFAYFGVDPLHQHKVLFWGIFGALVLRILFILAGVALIQKFHWIIYIFGVFLIYTGIKMITEKDRTIHPEKNIVLRLFRKFFPVSPHFDGGRFFTLQNGRRVATPLFIVLIVIETSDIIFALDSIPAILAITYDPFIVYTSNVFAIFGLRALYFAIAGMMRVFRYLQYGVAVILVFVGLKMGVSEIYKIPVHTALAVIFAMLALSIIASVVFPDKNASGGAGKPGGGVPTL
jgi:tellurite resistance protein TerC